MRTLAALGLFALAGLLATVGAFYYLATGGSGGGTAAAAAGAAGVIVTSGAPALPVSGPFVMTSEYGMRYFRGAEFHDGLDFAGPGNPPIMAPTGGTITYAAPAGSAGNMVQIDHADGVEAQYMHLARIDVKVGDSVWPGRQLGLQGTTGDSTGPHLHLRTSQGGKSLNPRDWLTGLGLTVPPPGGSGTGPAPALTPPDTNIGMTPGAARGARLNTAGIPAAFTPWVVKAAAVCAESPAPLIAAQIVAESGWNVNATSPVGAQGPAQFMPGTWAAIGRDDDGNGRASPNDIGDAVMALARYTCANARLVAGTPGDKTALMLAAYNVGPGAVSLHGGVPPYAETRAYITRITTGMAAFTL